MKIDSAKIRAAAKMERDRALASADAARHSPITTEDYLTWNEARHQAWQTYTRAVLAIADEGTSQTR